MEILSNKTCYAVINGKRAYVKHLRLVTVRSLEGVSCPGVLWHYLRSRHLKH